MKPIALFTAAAITIAAVSCTTPKNITYFPDLATGTTVQAGQELPIRIQPEDKLTIIVSTQDPTLSAMFNLMTVQNRITSTTTSTRSSGASLSGNSQVGYYTVNSKGEINFPVLGVLKIAGMTREELTDFIVNQLVSRDLVKDPIVTVEFVNTGISIIGEVKSPGRYEFNKDRLTIIDAIAMAGDLTMNGVRENILVLRNLGDGRQEAYRINLLDAQELAASPVYYLQQDDVIYVEPNDKAKRDTTPMGNSPFTPSFWLTIASFAMTITSFILMFTR